MAAEKGSAFLLKIGNGAPSPVFSTVAGLRTTQLSINGEAVVLHVGKFPDVNGKSHDLVIREGRVQLWRDEAPVEGHLSEECFYEVVTNRKLITQLTTPQA